MVEKRFVQANKPLTTNLVQKFHAFAYISVSPWPEISGYCASSNLREDWLKVGKIRSGAVYGQMDPL